MENVASMLSSDRAAITRQLEPIQAGLPYWLDAKELAPVRRPRLYWTSWEVDGPGTEQSNSFCVVLPKDDSTGFTKIDKISHGRIPVESFLDPGVQKCGDLLEPFPTAVRWIVRKQPPDKPAGIQDCDSATLAKWEASRFAMAPYQFKRELGVITPQGEERPPNADERERLHG